MTYISASFHQQDTSRKQQILTIISEELVFLKKNLKCKNFIELCVCWYYVRFLIYQIDRAKRMNPDVF
jgi:hypothetical protein